MRVFDLSLPIDPTSADPFSPKIEYQTHAAGVAVMARLFGVPEADIPDGKGSASEVVHIKTHSGTHMDAPWHYYPTSEGKPAKTIDQLPLEWCIAPGVVIDCTHLAAGTEITPDDLKRQLDRIEYTVKPFDIVFIRTDTDQYYYQPDYTSRHAGMGRDATLWLIEQGVKIMGIDAWAWDIPLRLQGQRYLAGGSKDKSILWAAHRVGKDHEYFHIEQLANLGKLPRPHGFTACVFPIKVPRASAGWVRAAAVFHDLE